MKILNPERILQIILTDVKTDSEHLSKSLNLMEPFHGRT